MDKTTDAGKAASQQSAIDWFSFHQGADNNSKPGKVGDQSPPPQPGQDPYDYNQGPSKPGDPAKPGKHRQSSLTLYDVAESTLKAEGKKSYKQDDIYFRLNDMMVAHGFQKANIDGRSHINDHMLPKSWNMVDPHKLLDTKPNEPPKDQPKDQPKDPSKDKTKDPGKDKPKDPSKDKAGEPNGKDQTPEEKARADYQKQVEAAIKEKYTLPPVEAKKGYYDTVAAAHPDWKPKQILEEAKRVRHLNNENLNLTVGERLYTISKEERQKMMDEAMAAYDKQRAPQGQV